MTRWYGNVSCIFIPVLWYESIGHRLIPFAKDSGFDVLFLLVWKLLNKQTSSQWLETAMWRHCNGHAPHLFRKYNIP